MKLRSCIWILAAFAAFLYMSTPAAALAAREKNPEIQHIVVTSADGMLLLSASVRGAFTRELVSELRAGGTLHFVFHVELVRKGTGWFDASMQRTSLNRDLRYDKAKDEYIFTAPETRDEPRKTQSLNQAEQWMSSFNQVPVAQLSSLVADAPYAIHMQADLKQGMLPFDLGRFIPIWQVSGIKTDRRTIEFRY